MKLTRLMTAVLLVLMSGVLLACSTGNAGTQNASSDDTIDVVWYPNESGKELKSSRDAIGKVIADATGKDVKHHLTTDYAIAIETLVNNNADVAFLGAQGYIEAKAKNDAITPLAVATGPSGTLEDAKYHSWLAVQEGTEDKFKKNGEFSLDTLEGKNMSFVSTSSTSGFQVPSATIVDHFSSTDKYAELTSEDLMQGGTLFDQVLFGNSHQGSAVNLLQGNADVAAFCDTCVDNYVEVSEGEENKAGSVYKVKDDAAKPFDTVKGSNFTLMSVTPVLNAPFAANVESLGEEDYNNLKEAFTSDEVAGNEEIFVPEDSGKTGLFFKSGDERFAPVEDSWFDPIRELSQ
ncbi:PhnD/SsuA/transferrin family substrate-binding protein [Lentibacillus amyloliquefaciens]|uniref:Phosphonate ABC transporter substrate-binding protein n=1 Tax=Lentibacillus amyloliquefaciens TaxID=1472767 RepID=A0A0U4EHS2_9BACI|nr:PhnD/SsuA/transferrin family substrate-binding protein [Lentibacillus amyloliquefaciens]ALX50025.1 phosphonate ABC transporter substrate-binding protein [Lentibacillus amyloliquefaciens]